MTIEEFTKILKKETGYVFNDKQLEELKNMQKHYDDNFALFIKSAFIVGYHDGYWKGSEL